MSNTLTINGVIRPLKASDLENLIAHYLRLDAISRHDRFQAGLSDVAVMLYAEKAMEQNAYTFGYFIDGVLRGVTELRSFGEIHEIAFSVENDFQNKGIGSALLSRVLIVARSNGLKQVRLSFLPSNTSMRHVSLKYGAKITSDFDQAYAVFNVEGFGLI